MNKKLEKNQYIELEDKFGAQNYKPLNVVISKGEGIWVWDSDGNKYLDALSGYSALNQGHVHPRILSAMIDQARRLPLTSRAFRNDQLPLFYEEICSLTNSHKVLMMNSGAEAVETAIKVARKWGYVVKKIPKDRAEIIVCDNNFHGRTITIVGFSSDKLAKADFGPYAKGFKSVKFGDIEMMRSAISKNTAAILLEPIQGEAGVIIPPPTYLSELRKLCDQHNILLILDEIQTGLGRTGKLLAEQHYEIEADLTLIGKALSGGFYPVSAILSNDEALGLLKPGEHGSTFGGNPLACAIARESLKVIIEEGMIENSAKMGKLLLEGLKSIKSNVISDVRGLGLMSAIEFDESADYGRKICELLKDAGVLAKESKKNTLRLSPPLIIKPNEIDIIISGIKKAIRSI